VSKDKFDQYPALIVSWG